MTLLLAVGIAGCWGLFAIVSYPIIVIADSDLGVGAMQRVRDGGRMALWSLAVILAVSRLLPLQRLRIVAAAVLAAGLSCWSFESNMLPHYLVWPSLGVLGLGIATEFAEAPLQARSPLRRVLPVYLLMPVLLVLSDRQEQILIGRAPQTTAAIQSGMDPGLRVSISVMDGSSAAARSRSSQMSLTAQGDDNGVLSIQGTGGAALRVPPGGSERMIKVLCFSPDGKTLAVADDCRLYQSSFIRIYDVAAALDGSPPSAKLRHTLGPFDHWTFAMDFFPDNRTLLAANGDNRVRLFDTIAGVEVASIIGHRHPDGWETNADCVAASPDGAHFATWAMDELKIWERGSLSVLRVLKTPESIPCALAFSQDGREVIGKDRVRICRWEVRPNRVEPFLTFAVTAFAIGWILWIRMGRAKAS